MPVIRRSIDNNSASHGDRNKFRVFIVDDHEVMHDAIQKVVEKAPEKDLAFVGSYKYFDSNIPKIIKQSGANVVLIDIMEGDTNPAGLRAFRMVRQHLGSEIGIIAYSVYTSFEKICIDNGADILFPKGFPNDELRNAIRSCKDHDCLTKLELFPEDKRICLHVKRSGLLKEIKTTLQWDMFALLYYLCEERLSGEMDWITKDNRTGNYTCKENTRVAEIRARFKNKKDDEDKIKSWDNGDLSRLSSLVKQRIQSIPLSNQQQLIIVPGVGRGGQDAYSNSYYLNPFIEKSQIIIHEN
jgi:CheY-like chemotaxis protein